VFLKRTPAFEKTLIVKCLKSSMRTYIDIMHYKYIRKEFTYCLFLEQERLG
jgi:hypothetical protein